MDAIVNKGQNMLWTKKYGIRSDLYVGSSYYTILSTTFDEGITLYLKCADNYYQKPWFFPIASFGVLGYFRLYRSLSSSGFASMNINAQSVMSGTDNTFQFNIKTSGRNELIWNYCSIFEFGTFEVCD